MGCPASVLPGVRPGAGWRERLSRLSSVDGFHGSCQFLPLPSWFVLSDSRRTALPVTPLHGVMTAWVGDTWLPTLHLPSRDARSIEVPGLLGGCSASPAHKVPRVGSAFAGEPRGLPVPLRFAWGQCCAAEGVVSWQ